MRITDIQATTILEGVHKYCGKNARVWLFGSRVDDAKRGGDIDLYIETEIKDTLLDAKLKLLGFFEKAFGEQKIDILLRSLFFPMTAMHEMAKSTGIELLPK